jgi:hypothetical protein
MNSLPCFASSTPCQILVGDYMREDEMIRICCMLWSEKKCIQTFVRELNEKRHLKRVMCRSEDNTNMNLNKKNITTYDKKMEKSFSSCTWNRP